MRRFTKLSVLAVVASLVQVVVPAAAAERTVLQAPVDASVLDPFRPPDGPFGPGNRGIEYDTAVGDRVDAAGPGVVVFAGSVAGATWLTIDHGSGLKTSYGPLRGITVGRGDEVSGGARLAAAAGSLHFSARVDGTYVDPATLYGELVIDVRLVPHAIDDDRSVQAAHERAERLRLYDLAVERSGGDGLLSRVGQWVSGTVRSFMPDQLVAGLAHSIDIGVALGHGLDQRDLARELVTGLVTVLDPEPCTASGSARPLASPPRSRRIAVVVDGLGSSSEAAGLAGDLTLTDFGYDHDDIVRFSYAGGLTDGGGARWGADVPRTSYGEGAAGRPIAESVDAFSDTLRQIRAANPATPIDIYGHSAGGVVARLASAEMEHEVDLGVVMTFASPHGGAPLATVNDALFSSTPGIVVGQWVDAFDPSSPLRAPAVADLSEAGFVGDTASIAFPAGVHAVTIGHRADLVVPGTESDAPGARHVIVGGFDPRNAHGAIGALPEVHEEVRLALAGLAPACQSAHDALFDLVTGTVVAGTERAAAGAILAAGVGGKAD